LKKNIIEQKKVGRKFQYIVIDQDELAKALIRFKEGFIDEVVDDFAKTWMEIHP